MSSFRGVAIAMLVVATMTGCSSSDGGETPAEPEKQDGPVLDGAYKFDFDIAKRTALGQPAPKADSVSANWVFRSNCGDNGCIATGTRLNSDGSASNTRTTLDFVDGQWVMVLGEDSRCNAGGQPARVFGTWTLKPAADNSLTGMWSEITTGPDCPWVLQMPVTVTREGDAPEGVDVADPATVPARTPSKAEGFRGSYTQTVTERPATPPAPPAPPAVLTVEVATYCVRNTEECASTQSTKIENDPQVTPLSFANGRGTYRWDRGQRTCAGGAPVQSFGYDEVVLPDPAPNPVPRLTGSRRLENLAPCPGDQWFDLLYERKAAPPPAAPAPGG